MAKLHPYTETLETLSNIDSGKVKISEIKTTIATLKSKASSGKVAGADGKEITNYDELLKVLGEIKGYDWGLGTHTYIEDFTKIYERKADKDIGGVITSKVNALNAALKTPSRTKEWANSSELSSPNWDMNADEKAATLEKINTKFAEVEKDLVDWVATIQKTNPDEEAKRKKTWLSKK